eukprot:TRINITY_DN50177_c0_g1_i1.p1 TRINITY_DN50177_c0_g1~~TRINITY_DN50177_c0_g1_i1.p1  ORF type:complete len:435 (+),score=138.41 TRINITY_DN50177_c0_g1_i1:154-1305(+)
MATPRRGCGGRRAALCRRQASASAFAPTRALLREAWGKFGQQARPRPVDYRTPSKNVRSLEDVHHGWMFPLDNFTWMRPRQFTSGSPSILHWYSAKGMRNRQLTRTMYWNWYQNALGSVEYMDGFSLPDLQDAKDLVPEEGEREPVLGRISSALLGDPTRSKAVAFARDLEALRIKKDRDPDDIRDLIDRHEVLTAEGARAGDPDPDDVLEGQPRAVYETLLVLSAEARDWINVNALIDLMGQRGIALRSVVTAALFGYVENTNRALHLFERLKRSNVRLHLNTYYALMASFQKVEEREQGGTLHDKWVDTQLASGDMVDFIVGGVDDQIFPETNPLARVGGRDPQREAAAAIRELLDRDREVISEGAGEGRKQPELARAKLR